MPALTLLFVRAVYGFPPYTCIPAIAPPPLYGYMTVRPSVPVRMFYTVAAIGVLYIFRHFFSHPESLMVAQRHDSTMDPLWPHHGPTGATMEALCIRHGVTMTFPWRYHGLLSPPPWWTQIIIVMPWGTQMTMVPPWCLHRRLEGPCRHHSYLSPSWRHHCDAMETPWGHHGGLGNNTKMKYALNSKRPTTSQEKK